MWELFQQGGWVMYPILGCSVLSWAVIFERLFHYGASCGKRNQARLQVLSRAHAAAHAAGLGAEARERAVLRSAGSFIKADGRGLAFLGAVAALGPLLGLFGTVLGMIELFRSLATSGAQPEFSDLVGGVWTALLTTAFGLVAAIPAHGCSLVFDRWAELRADDLRQHFLNLEAGL